MSCNRPTCGNCGGRIKIIGSSAKKAGGVSSIGLGTGASLVVHKDGQDEVLDLQPMIQEAAAEVLAGSVDDVLTTAGVAETTIFDAAGKTVVLRVLAKTRIE